MSVSRGALLIGLLLLAPSLSAQSQASTGVIRGSVSGPTGEPIAHAEVVVRSGEASFERRVASGARGFFAATLLPVGTYEVTARSTGALGEVARRGVSVRLGETVELALRFAPVSVDPLDVRGVVDADRSQTATRFGSEAVARLPNDGRNFLALTALVSQVGTVQGPDGDEITIAGQRGIHNNISVDGADFNNPFWGNQRGGQRPPFTFNLDAVQEMVVVSQGAPAEFGRSSGGFINVITRSGTNELHGSAHYYGQNDAYAGSRRGHGVGSEPDFTQQQMGFTLGGPLRRDSMFFFIAYDRQVMDETKQQLRPTSPALDSLRTFLASAFGGVLANDFGPIERTSDADALLLKVDARFGSAHNATLKFNRSTSEQVNGTFDVDTWGRSSNAVERSTSHAISGSLSSQISPRASNELRFQLAEEGRPRPYDGPLMPGTDRPFPDTGMDFASGFRLGMPFFIPITYRDYRVQLLDNVSIVRGTHLIKLGAEWNRTEATQTFVGFGNGRFIFGSVTGFMNYVRSGPGYVECSNGPSRLDGRCPGGTITGPVLLYLQLDGMGHLLEEAGTQSLPQHDLAVFLQDSWKAAPNLTVDYGLRWEAQVQPGPLTPPGEVFFSPLIGKTVTNTKGSFTFPSDGTIPSEWTLFQPRLGVAWDLDGDGRRVVRASSGLYYARIPSLNVAQARATNGTITQTLVRSSASTGTPLGPPPRYDQLLIPRSGAPTLPDVFVIDRDFRNPRTWSTSLAYDRALTSTLGASVSVMHARTDFLTRFVNRNDTVFGSPWSTGIGPGGSNGVGALTVVESSARSRYTSVSVGLHRTGDVQLALDYTLSWDRSDDDNEHDPFTYRYARPDRLEAEYGWSDRDRRHRLNGWMLAPLPAGVELSQRVSLYSAQPVSEKCGAGNVGTGVRAASPADRACPNGSVLERNTLRKDDDYFSWDVRLARSFPAPGRGRLEARLEVFNVLNRDNFRDPASPALLFNFDGTIRSGLGEPRQLQAGLRWAF